MEVKNPMTEGLPTDWDVMEELWSHGFEKILRVDPKEHPLLLAEPSFNTQANREKQAEIAFEKFGVQALFIAKNSLLSAFSVGRSSALVVDIGHSSVSVSPVCDGYSLRNATVRSNVAGQMLNEYMSALLHKEHSIEVQPRFSFSRKHDREGNLKVTKLSFPLTHPSYETLRRLEIVADVKESCCVMPEMTLNEKLAAKMPKVPYELPDGTQVGVGIERYRVPELLMDPSKFVPALEEAGQYGSSLLGAPTIEGPGQTAQSSMGLHNLVHASMVQCDVDIRKEMLQHILLVGGSSTYANLTQRLTLELTKMVPSSYKVRTNLFRSHE
jgi:actin-like protein 6A